ncbi:LPS O-antigen chain length determinant protein WzzB [Pseudomonas profundi]|uniref:LPS O-antigen chain length determinant protein WzzB n=1 Tax=Pseudomonas profundi TaxID=1981513 RepID=UPI001CC2520E|nr:Wzz/FepE/Etk N-terminal domain-containing protein [Pseudomonas profundi]
MYEDRRKRVPREDMGEIDLFELCGSLWKEKWLIVAVTVLGAALAVAYALTITPVYKTEATVIPPRQSDIAAFNVGRLSVSAAQRSLGGESNNAAPLSDYTAEQVYSVFKRNLLSASLRNAFFEQHYLPYRGVDLAEEDAAARDSLLNRFNQTLTVRQPDQRGRPDYYEVAVELKDPELAAAWANQYVNVAAERATQEMVENVLSEITTRSRVAEIRIDGLRTFAQQQRQDRIARLREALGIATALEIESPQITAGRTSADSELAAFVEGDLMYMRGTRALQAELNMLENREIDDPFVPELRALESQLMMLRGISIDKDAVSVFTLDGAADVPETPIKPRKPLIVVLGALLGGMLGVVIALLRIALRNRSAPATTGP